MKVSDVKQETNINPTLQTKNQIENESLNEFLSGAKAAIPIALGYLPISFTFALVSLAGGISDLFVILISLSNFTAAGQFAAVNLFFMGASIYEIALTTFVINSRYALMSLSLVQRLSSKVPLRVRSIIAYGITDEIFTVASVQKDKFLSPKFLFGLELVGFSGWVGGTALGVFLASYFPPDLRNAMCIALYAMFIAILIPAAKKSRPVLLIGLISISITSTLKWVPLFSSLSSGFRIIVATIIAATIGAVFFPKEVNENE